MPDRFQQATIVKPIDPIEGAVLYVIERGP